MSEISQYIKFGDLTTEAVSKTNGYLEPEDRSPNIDVFPEGVEPGMETHLSRGQEDLLLRDSTGDLPDWVANFVRRVILLLENLPDEGASGAADGATEGTISHIFLCPEADISL